INDLSTWYVRRSRDRMKLGNEDAKAALATLAFVLCELSKLLAPFMPFLSDFIYRDVAGKESVHLESWSVFDATNDGVIAQMEIVREIASLGLAVRKEKSVPVRQPLANFAFDLNDEKADLEPEYIQLILEELNVKKLDVNLTDKDIRGEGVVIVPGTKFVKNFYLDLNLTPELKQEGVGRELERQVQDLRKKSGLKVGELVDLYYNTQDEALEQVLLSNFDRKKTFVSQVSKSLEIEVDFESQAVVDGKAIWLGMIKI
ncbi:MAG TPA: class I tRNA ligase family protein, partial [Candidatus Limnocylindria bacterium]|nr:class I tRNA ligase family protein [Candidatus Limnocylindria bacterium]